MIILNELILRTYASVLATHLDVLVYSYETVLYLSILLTTSRGLDEHVLPSVGRYTDLHT